MSAGKYSDAEAAARKAMWLHHPAGALAFEFMPDDYYDDPSTGVGNGAVAFDDRKLFIARNHQELALRMTWTAKDRSLLMAYRLDELVHKRDSIDFTRNFKFWSDVAINSESISSQVGLLRRYQLMVDSGYQDRAQIIEPLIFSIVYHMVHGDYNYAVYHGYVEYILKILSNRKYISLPLLYKLFDSYSNYDLDIAVESIMNVKVYAPKIRYSRLDQVLIDDFSLLNEFTYWCGPYALWFTDKGSNMHFRINCDFKDYLKHMSD